MNRGFTLLEVLAALLILTILITPITINQLNQLKQYEYQQELVVLNLLASGHLEELRSQYQHQNRQLFLVDVSTPRKGMAGEYHWQEEWQQVASGFNNSLYQVRVEYWREDEELKVLGVTVATYFMGVEI